MVQPVAMEKGTMLAKRFTVIRSDHDKRVLKATFVKLRHQLTDMLVHIGYSSVVGVDLIPHLRFRQLRVISTYPPVEDAPGLFTFETCRDRVAEAGKDHACPCSSARQKTVSPGLDQAS